MSRTEPVPPDALAGRAPTVPRSPEASLAGVALVHDYFVVAGGAERVAAELHRTFPDAPIFTSAFRPRGLPPGLEDADLRPSYLQHAPFVGRGYRAYLPLYPSAFARLPTRDFPLVVASSSAWAHTVTTSGRLIVYCHTPPRFLWQQARYLERERGSVKAAASVLAAPLLRALRKRDYEAAQRVHTFVANSRAVADRIGRYYGRPAEVVPPPVDVDRFRPGEQEDYALVIARLQPYKQIDLAIQACERLELPLLVVGEGPARAALAEHARGRTRFLGRLSDEEVARLVGSARVLITPGEEDFGIATLEANAGGCPVVAYGAGGALETVEDGATGVLFEDATVESLAEALGRAVSRDWDRVRLVAHARTFEPARFRAQMRSVVERVASS